MIEWEAAYRKLYCRRLVKRRMSFLRVEKKFKNMTGIKKQLVAFFMTMMMVFLCGTFYVPQVNASEGSAIYSEETELYSKASYDEVLMEAVAALVESVSEPVYAQTGGDWAVLGVARAGYKDLAWYATYYENIVNAVTQNGTAKLSSTKSSENSRVILALTAIGADVTSVGGYNLLEPLSDFDYIKKQGINGAIYALLALDSGDYDILSLPTGSTGTQTTREGIIEYILEKELSGGGFDLSSLSANADVTAMALQALAPYYKTNESVAAAVDRGLAVLSDMQNDDGTFSSYGAENAESTAQVVTALSILGIDSNVDSQFVKSGGSALDGLLSFYDEESKAFKHTTSVNQMATEQSVYALVAYERYKNNSNSLYDMSDVQDVLYLAGVQISSIENGKNGIKLAWENVTNADGYIIYRKSKKQTTWKKYKTISSGDKLSFTDKKTSNGVTYSYKICATSGGIQGTFGGSKTICRLKKETAAAVNNGTCSIKITWSKNKKADGYQIRYSTKASMKGTKTVKVKSSNKNKKTISGLKTGKKYYVTVRSYKIVNGKKYYSAWSKKVKVKA